MSFRPYVSDEAQIPEFTLTAVILGCLQGVLFGVADAYLALKLGMTVGASIPAAVVSMSILRGLLRRGTVLENNLVQNMASVGESLACGAAFTIPALYLLQDAQKTQVVSLAQVYFICCVGGLMGIFFMIPMRRYLIVQEHGRLRYPEGTACAEVLMAGDKGGSSAFTVFFSILVAGLYRLAMNAFGLFQEFVSWPVQALRTTLSFDFLPSLLAVGFILGLETCGVMLAGAWLGWFVLIPAIAYFGAGTTLPPAQEAIGALSPDDIYRHYLRYIGAGAVAFGGLVGLVRALPTIWQSLAGVLGALRSQAPVTESRTSQDIPIKWVFAAWLGLFLAVGINHAVNPAGWLGAFLTVVFAFFFVTVSSRIVGLVGTTSMPLSGMTIGALLVTCFVIKAWGFVGPAGIAASLVIASMVCIAISMGGDISQDLKIGFLLGATPRWVQVTQVIAVLVSSLSVCKLLDYFAPAVIAHEFNAPQANLLYLVTCGVMQGNLPWTPVLIGMSIAAFVEMMGVGSLTFAVGLYLPLELSTTLVFGGLIHWVFHRLYAVERHKSLYDHGLLVCSGLVAGDALVGVWLAYMTRSEMDWTVKGFGLAQNKAWACFCFAVLAAYLIYQVRVGARTSVSSSGPSESPDDAQVDAQVQTESVPSQDCVRDSEP